ncbi:MAG: tetratricopeptide repeat protein [Pseudomonadota bacterium]|nr:tetratricopeptide repeat protein [Pseudomonadota bacterium]
MKKKPLATDNYAGLVRPLTSLAALAGLVAAFIGLFPSQQRLNALSRQRESDALSIAYLQLLLRTHPEDEALRSAVAHNLAGVGKWEEARGTLAPLVGQASETGQRMRMEALELELFILQQLPKDSPQRSTVMATLTAQIEALRREPLQGIALVRLAEISLAVTLPGTAAQIYHQLAAREPGKRQGWLDLAATQYLASNAPERAAPVYEESALQAVGDSAAYRKYTLLALDAYLAANQGSQALKLAQAAAPRLDGDAEFMRRAVALALAQNDVASAQRLGRQLVTLLPGDVAVLSRQLELEVALRDAAAALRLATSLVALEPGEPEHHLRLARMAEWAGKPALALEQWLLLARGAPASPAMDNALRLALGLQNDGLWLALATQTVQKRPLTAQESAALVAIQARDGAAGPLIAFLSEYRKRYALQPAQGEALANALAQQGNVPAALAVWQEMSPRLISPVEAASRQAELLMRLKKPEDAWAVLLQARPQARPADTAYWQVVGDLAWEREPRSEALPAYLTVLAAGAFNVLALERLIQLYNASAEPQKAIALGRQAYQRLGEARWLLLAMDAASQASAWDELRSLSRLARNDEEKFAKSEMYWLLEAQLASHDASKARARSASQRALALNPASVATRVQVLWLEIDGGSPPQLDGYLQQWRGDAQAEPAYWAAYAVALLQLKKPQEALVWFDRQARAQPNDALWGLSHAQALEAAGQKDAARRLRGSLLPRLKEKLGPADQLTKPRDKGLMLTYASIVREFEGAPASDQVLQQLLGRGQNDADVYQLLVDSSLSQEKFDKAHDWLQRAEAAHHPLPAYQALAVALAQNDRPALEQLLQQRDKELSAADQVTALRQLGRHVLALSLTEKSLLNADDESTERLRQHREQLRAQLSRRIEAGYQARNLTDLKIKRAEAAASFAFDSGRATVRLAHNRLRSDGQALKAVDGLNENDASVLGEVAFGQDPLRFTLGRNQRADKSLTYGRFEWTHALGKRLQAHLDISLHGLTEETSALRAFGRKDKVAIGLSGNPSEASYARLALAGQRFASRSGDKLGDGYRLDGEFGGTPFKSAPAWQMRVSGSTEKNRLVDHLPPALAASLQLPAQAVPSVLSPRFSTLGVGATYRSGLPEAGARQAQTIVDGWVGRQWPANELAYSLRAGMTVPVRQAGQVRVEGFYTNVQGGVSTQANRGVALWYRHEF